MKLPKIPKSNAQKAKIESQIKALEAKKTKLLRNKPVHASRKFYADLNKINKDIENLEKKL